MYTREFILFIIIMAPAQTSMVWLFFKKSADNKIVTCNLCKQQLKYFVSTSNLRQHIVRKHGIQYNQLQKDNLLSTDTKIENEDNFITFSVYEDTSSKLEDVPENGLDNTAKSQEVMYEESGSSNDEIEAATESRGSTDNLAYPVSRNITASSKKKRGCCDHALRIIESMVSKTVVNKYGGRHDSFGSYVVQELEHMPKDMAVYCKKIINDAIYQAQLGNLTPYSKVINEQDPMSGT
ncbi:unnamed protein product [Callosobruchus maculatus]|uniref:BED-type domain-containing protein n=1 Tax=Callosobruchus maculatus TaxID=64391 RepID=A0A653BIL7_CALMS|nr:unnamed protein product [Callosobruchus maculatus]